MWHFTRSFQQNLTKPPRRACYSEERTVVLYRLCQLRQETTEMARLQEQNSERRELALAEEKAAAEARQRELMGVAQQDHPALSAAVHLICETMSI